MATRAAIVEGQRNVLIAAPTNNALIVTGDRNTVEMRLEGAGAALAFAFRWHRPRPRRRGDRPSAPPCFERHVDRDAEVRTVAGDDGAPRVVNLYGPAGIGKTHVLVEALNRRECEMRDGAVYLDGRGRDAEDLLHAIFEVLFECRVPLRDLQIERHLDDRRAVVALEDVDVASERAQRLALAVPSCRVFVTSRERVLYDGVALKIDGLAAQHAVAIAEQELGRPLSVRERAAAESVAEGLRGHPLQLRQIFGRARDAGLSIEQLAPRAATAVERAQALSPEERQVARTLAVHGDASLGVEHIEALAGYGARSAAVALEARHEARSHSPRYSLAGGLSDAFEERELAPELDRALEHFIGWGEDEARAGRRDAVLRETAALVALLERAQAAGRADDVVRLGLAIEGALAWGNRWQAWRRVLELVLAAARENGDRAA
ncbi:MAG TPA: NB-ARC domain-containing protein, partial [Solirubrobacteraceae bacterium]|nr:NB-ARC domain-containing protein [Solirubrobacteraceae bacterium]